MYHQKPPGHSLAVQPTPDEPSWDQMSPEELMGRPAAAFNTSLLTSSRPGTVSAVHNPMSREEGISQPTLTVPPCRVPTLQIDLAEMVTPPQAGRLALERPFCFIPQQPDRHMHDERAPHPTRNPPSASFAEEGIPNFLASSAAPTSQQLSLGRELEFSSYLGIDHPPDFWNIATEGGVSLASSPTPATSYASTDSRGRPRSLSRTFACPARLASSSRDHPLHRPSYLYNHQSSQHQQPLNGHSRHCDRCLGRRSVSGAPGSARSSSVSGRPHHRLTSSPSGSHHSYYSGSQFSSLDSTAYNQGSSLSAYENSWSNVTQHGPSRSDQQTPGHQIPGSEITEADPGWSSSWDQYIGLFESNEDVSPAGRDARDSNSIEPMLHSVLSVGSSSSLIPGPRPNILMPSWQYRDLNAPVAEDPVNHPQRRFLAPSRQETLIAQVPTNHFQANSTPPLMSMAAPSGTTHGHTYPSVDFQDFTRPPLNISKAMARVSSNTRSDPGGRYPSNQCASGTDPYGCVTMPSFVEPNALRLGWNSNPTIPTLPSTPSISDSSASFNSATAVPIPGRNTFDRQDMRFRIPNEGDFAMTQTPSSVHTPSTPSQLSPHSISSTQSYLSARGFSLFAPSSTTGMVADLEVHAVEPVPEGLERLDFNYGSLAPPPNYHISPCLLDDIGTHFDPTFVPDASPYIIPEAPENIPEIPVEALPPSVPRALRRLNQTSKGLLKKVKKCVQESLSQGPITWANLIHDCIRAGFHTRREIAEHLLEIAGLRLNEWEITAVADGVSYHLWLGQPRGIFEPLAEHSWGIVDGYVRSVSNARTAWPDKGKKHDDAKRGDRLRETDDHNL